jgi:CubicO group peptidase (beta-lactamase class C family)
MPPDSTIPSFDPQDVNLANWRGRPYNTWSFRNLAALIPTAAIPAPAVAPAAAEYTSALRLLPASLDQFSLGAGSKALSLEQFLRKTCTDGLVVSVDGRIAYEFYDNGTTADTPHILMSVTKSLVSLVAGILHARGSFDVNAAVEAILPEVAGTAFQGATIQQLLDMRTGVIPEGTELAAYDAASGWAPIPASEPPADLLGYFSHSKAPLRPHGGPFSYISANTDLLGLAMERATGKRFTTLASELLWQPMGAETDASITTDGHGVPRCAGGMCASARDLARVGALMGQTGTDTASTIIPRSWFDDTSRNGDRAAWKNGEFAAGFPGKDMSYRNGWYVFHDASPLVFAMGTHGQYLFVDRARRLSIAKLSSLDRQFDPMANKLTMAAVEEITRCLFGA